jgi:CDP-diacylglycerol---glycerol-3-phosphate 3-phosphatidyltransferase
MQPSSPALAKITLPTWITLSRLLVIPIILGIFHFGSDPIQRQIALAAFLVGALTDWLDGYLARSLNQVSELGKFLDPLVDKLLVIAPLLVLVELAEIPAWSVFILIARELLITAWRGKPVENSSIDRNPEEASDQKKAANIQGANIWGKLKTVFQIVAIAALLIQLPFAIWLYWLALLLTVISGILYVVPNHL